jgi:hypothetical protein
MQVDMILLEIKKYLVARKRVNLQELAAHFQRDPAIMRSMISHWVRKNKVSVIKPVGCGVRCTQCKPEYAEEYEWAKGDSHE